MSNEKAGSWRYRAPTSVSVKENALVREIGPDGENLVRFACITGLSNAVTRDKP